MNEDIETETVTLTVRELFRTDDDAWTAAMDAARYAERRSDIVAKAVGAAAPLIAAAEIRRVADKIRRDIAKAKAALGPEPELDKGADDVLAAFLAYADELFPSRPA